MGSPLMFPESIPEAEFLDEIHTKVLRVSSLLFTVTSTMQLCLEIIISSKLTQPLTVINYHYGLRNPYRNLKSEESQDFAQKPQRNCIFMNSASDPRLCW
jgi:hypothetical protein